MVLPLGLSLGCNTRSKELKSRVCNPTFQYVEGEGEMYQAKWKDRAFSISSSAIRTWHKL